MIELRASDVVVTGLKRKDKVGTSFRTVSRVNGAQGFATLTANKKEGRREAVFQHSGEAFAFHTNDKQLWPDAFTTIGLKQNRTK